MRDGLQGRSCLEDLDCLRTVLLVEVGGLREFRMANGLVKAESRKGSGMTTGIGGRSTGARTLHGVKQGASRDNDPLLASETRQFRFDFL